MFIYTVKDLVAICHYRWHIANLRNYYNPIDNSWCVNIATGEDAWIVQDMERSQSLLSYEYYISCKKEERGAIFEVVKEPYWMIIPFVACNRKVIRMLKEFVDVKSSLTGNVYRTLHRTT